MRVTTWLAYGLALLPVTRAGAGTETGFTFQGELREEGSPVDDVCELVVSLHDAASGGSQIGSTLVLTDVDVENGVFTVELDFGADALDVDERWLELEIDCPGGPGGAVPLGERIEVGETLLSGQTRGLHVSDTGNVAIGGSGAPARLTVTSHTASGGDNTARFYSPQVGSRKSHVHYGTTGDWYIRAADPSGDVLIQNDGGFVGVGTSSPSAPLDVVHGGSTAALSVQLLSGHAGISDAVSGSGPIAVKGVSGASFGTGIKGESTAIGGEGVAAWTNQPAGVGSGLVGRSHGASGFGIYGHATNGIGVHSHWTGGSGTSFLALGVGTNYGSSSSARWKRNVERIPDPLGKLDEIRGVTFDWDEAHGGHHDVGMIAEEVGAVLPEIVVYEANGVDAHGMDYAKVSPLLVEALNEVRRRYDARLATLQERNESLRAQVEALELAAIPDTHAVSATRLNYEGASDATH